MESNRHEFSITAGSLGSPHSRQRCWLEAAGLDLHRTRAAGCSVGYKYVGVSYPNIACLPSKSVIYTAQFAHDVRRSEEFGVSIDGFRIDMSVVRERKRGMVQGLVDTYLALYEQSGAELIIASGRFVGLKTIDATLADGTKRMLRGENVVIGTGTHAAIENIPGLASAQS